MITIHSILQRKAYFLALPACVAMLFACSKPDASAAAPIIRPVQTLRLAAQGTALEWLSFSAEIRPHIESRLAFRVGGKITQRLVELGAKVHKGQALFKLDATDLNLGAQASNAQINAAKANNDVAQAALSRAHTLAKQGFISAGSVDSAEGQAKAAQANLQAAQASANVQTNASQYATLFADSDGVVTAIDAEAGQVVAAGTPVVRVGSQANQDVVFNVPESQLARVKALRGQAVTVQLWANKHTITAVVHDIAAIADASTRSFAVKASVQGGADIPLGATATVSFPAADLATANVSNRFLLPVSAVVESNGKPQVWVLDKGAVNLKPVVLGAVQGDAVMATGLAAGDEIVTAGTHTLVAGQAVKSLLPAAIQP